VNANIQKQRMNVYAKYYQSILSSLRIAGFLPSVQEENAMSDSARLFGLSALFVPLGAHTHKTDYDDGSNLDGRTR